MMRRSYILLPLLIILALTSCKTAEYVLEVPTLTALPTYTEQPTLTVLPTYTPQATLTPTPKASNTPQESPTPTVDDPTLTPLPTLTLLPTSTLSGPKVWVTVTPYTAATDLAPSALKEVWNCEDLSVSVIYSDPELVETLSGNFSVGIFLMMRVKLASISGKTYAPLTTESFRILGSLYGRDVTYYLDRNLSDFANSRWETPYLNTEVTSAGFETYLVFDVNQFTKNYSFEFCPIPTGEEQPVCCVTFPLPAVKK